MDGTTQSDKTLVRNDTITRVSQPNPGDKDTGSGVGRKPRSKRGKRQKATLPHAEKVISDTLPIRQYASSGAGASGPRDSAPELSEVDLAPPVIGIQPRTVEAADIDGKPSLVAPESCAASTSSVDCSAPGKRPHEGECSSTAASGGGAGGGIGGEGGDKGVDGIPAPVYEDDTHKFWSRSPGPRSLPPVQREDEERPLPSGKSKDDLPAVPTKLPGGILDWCEVDPADEKQLNDLHELLTDSYIESGDGQLRIRYSKRHLQWALQSPRQLPDMLVGVRSTKSGKLLGFIAGIPVNLVVSGHRHLTCEVNFLCVSRKLRSKRLSPVLVRELTRRTRRNGIWHGMYTAGVELPAPVATTKLFSRVIRPRQLVARGAIKLPRGQSVSRVERMYRLPSKPSIRGLRAMTEDDVPQATELLNGYMAKRFKMWVHRTAEEVAHWMLPREGVLESFVVEDPESKCITGLGSYIVMPNTVRGGVGGVGGGGAAGGGGGGGGGVSEPAVVRLASQYYTVPGPHGIKAMMESILILARNREIDAMNVTSVMENLDMVDMLKFSSGEGKLYYYLSNWPCRYMEPSKLGVIMV